MERFSASRATQFMACPGSANLDLSIPGWVPPVQDDTVGRKAQGTFIHSMMEQASQLSPRDLQGLAEAMSYMATLRSQRRFKMLTELKVCADWLPSKPHTTLDVVLYTQDELHIVDYKAGKIPIAAENNKQLLFYTRSVIHLAPKAAGATLHIVQPWSKEGSSSWWASADDIAAFTCDAIATDETILAGDTTLHPSDACTFCPANPHSRGDKGSPLCPAMMNLLYPGAGCDEDAILNL